MNDLEPKYYAWVLVIVFALSLGMVIVAAIQSGS